MKIKGFNYGDALSPLISTHLKKEFDLLIKDIDDNRLVDVG